VLTHKITAASAHEIEIHEIEIEIKLAIRLLISASRR
jgi:hypothetical protein